MTALYGHAIDVLRMMSRDQQVGVAVRRGRYGNDGYDCLMDLGMIVVVVGN